MTASAITSRPRYTPRVEIGLREGPQFIAGLAGMLLALVDLDAERERAEQAAIPDDDQDQHIEERNP